VLIADGRLAFAGPIPSLRGFLADMGLDCGEETPAEFVMEILSSPDRAFSLVTGWTSFIALQWGSVQSLHHDNFRGSFNFADRPMGMARMGSKNRLAEIGSLSFSSSASFSSPPAPPPLRHSLSSVSRATLTPVEQIRVLVLRLLYYKCLSINGFPAMIFRFFSTVLVFIGLFYGNGRSLDKEDVIVSPMGVFTPYCSNIVGALFSLALFFIVSNAMSIPSTFAFKRVFEKEQVTF
jgi:hypothetical protein